MAATTLLLYFSHCGLKPVVLVVWTIQQQNPIDNSACVDKRLCCVLVSRINLSALALTEFKSKPDRLLITFVMKLSFIHNFTRQCVNGMDGNLKCFSGRPPDNSLFQGCSEMMLPDSQWL